MEDKEWLGLNRPPIPKGLIYPPTMTPEQVREMLYWQPKVTRWINTTIVLAVINLILLGILAFR